MTLNDVWFLLIAVLWTGYFVLEGFDFGVGMLLRVLGRDETERRMLINTIGPVWDGNEVWLLVAGGATFAAFPLWYSSLFSGFYLALLLILVALILRGVAFEFRGKLDSPRWRATWDWIIVGGSAVPAVLWGVAFANIVHGVPLDAGHHVTGTFLTLLNGYSLLGGLALASVFAFHGSVFLALKTAGEIRSRAQRLSRSLGGAAIVLGGCFLGYTVYEQGGWTWLTATISAALLVAGLVFTLRDRDGLAFASTAGAIIAVVATLFWGLYPDVLPSTTDPAHSLTVTNASSTPYTLHIMTWVAAIFTPLVLAYQAWTYWVFRTRLTRASIPADSGLASPQR
ncbi:cytochrome d ubiquinol oxidase subunit II [Amycolatopsis sp. PS_44_ISF1]|uniref:cytochrome d ubiquinol oxidase subunit II n=1 Tax=Amycolatopsis sp. PS_44_ISF1 TaxID=2974917 RepID=UPI0028DE5DEC|nr:cytochrome d ubiquinol oxidase subunit II [Amycolatopsis sp. PS_44_ISF1]MDT8913626.1 cytochrome d ubiquinol oxidase subunit II [Amycolatopsis sp. PS_44_ISF1]